MEGSCYITSTWVFSLLALCADLDLVTTPQPLEPVPYSKSLHVCVGFVSLENPITAYKVLNTILALTAVTVMSKNHRDRGDFGGTSTVTKEIVQGTSSAKIGGRHFQLRGFTEGI